MISVALADDHIATRKGVRSIIELNPLIQVTLEADNGQDLLTQLETAAQVPDVLLLDINMPVISGSVVIVEVRERWPKIKVIVYSFFNEIDKVIDMINRGACGYINKRTDPSTLAEAIITTHQKGFYLNDLVKKEYFFATKTSVKKEGYYGKVVFSPKEVNFIRYAATDLTYKEIATRMGVSPKTVENYRDSVFKKLEVKNRVQIAIYGLKNGIIDPES